MRFRSFCRVEPSVLVEPLFFAGRNIFLSILRSQIIQFFVLYLGYYILCYIIHVTYVAKTNEVAEKKFLLYIMSSAMAKMCSLG